MKLTRIIALVVLATLIAGCDDAYRYVSSGKVGWAIKKEIRDSQKKQLVLTRVTQFPWDEFFVFGSYTDASEICAVLQIPKDDCDTTIIETPMNHGMQLLVFRKDRKIIHMEIHVGWHGTFREGAYPLTPITAVFDVLSDGVLYDGTPALSLRPRKPGSSIFP
jgi:hypothetical protein